MVPAHRAQEGDKLRVFISYSRKDAVMADAIADALQVHGYQVTIDRRHLPFGEKWQRELADFIRLSDTVVWLVSDASVASKWVNWELDEVAKHNKRLIPIVVGPVLRDALPRQIGEIHLYPSTGVFELERDISALLQILATDNAWLKQGSRLHDRASEWIAKGRSPMLALSRGALSDAERWKDAQPDKAPGPSAEILELVIASRRLVARRQRRWLAGSFLVALVSLCLAGLAAWQRIIADDYAEVSQAGVDEMVFTITRALRETRGMNNDFAGKLLDSAERVVKKMAASAWDPNWQHRHVAILAEFSDIYAATGNITKQSEMAQKALQASRDLIAKYPAQPGFRRALWVSYGKAAVAEFTGGNYAAALDYWGAGMDTIQSLASEFPSSSRYARDVAITHASIGRIQLDMGRSESALESFGSCLLIRRKLSAAEPENIDLLREVALCISSEGDALAAMSRTTEAQDSYRSAVELFRHLADLQPDALHTKYLLSVALQHWAILLLRDDKRPEAEAYTLECNTLRRELAREDPSEIGWKEPCQHSMSR